MAFRRLGDLVGRYLGIGGATGDASNPLSVRGAGALFDGNTGGHQVRINKATLGDTASFLFQRGFSGRAEFGLIGNDNFELKVSADGSTFNQAFVVNDGTAVTDFKQQPTVNGQAIFHAGNDGSGSGLDADTVDGEHASAFAKLTGAVFTGGVTATGFTGPGGGLTGVNAATLEGSSKSAFALLSGAAFTGAVSAATLSSSGTIAAGGQLEITNANYGQHLKLTRSTESWQLDPSTDGSLDLRRMSGTGTARLDVAADLSVSGAFTVDGNTYLGSGLLEAHNGIQGGYNDGNGSGSNWGVPIWSMGDAYMGTSPGASFVPGTYSLTWQRISTASALADVGEGLYAYRAGSLIAGLGHTGTYLPAKLKVQGDTTVQGLGVGGASPDATNAFSFYGTNLLLNSGGSIDATFNKNAVGNDASFSFKTGFSARALLGLLGNDDFTLKVGSSFITAMVADHTTGKVTFPNTDLPSRQVYPIGGRWYMNTDNRWVGFSASYGAATENYNQNNGTGTEPSVVWNQFGPFIRQGAVLHKIKGALRSSSSETTAFDIRVILASSTAFAAGNWDSAGETTHNLVYSADNVSFTDTNWLPIDIDLGDWSVAADSFFLVFIKPVGTITAVRYLYGPLSLEYTASDP
uniref:Tail fiber protein n=1 Tax=Dinoroseobacter phage vB_DshS_R26L TaxID=3161158 RepID=A0AAU7VGT5_9CAUD